MNRSRSKASPIRLRSGPAFSQRTREMGHPRVCNLEVGHPPRNARNGVLGFHELNVMPLGSGSRGALGTARTPVSPPSFLIAGRHQLFESAEVAEDYRIGVVHVGMADCDLFAVRRSDGKRKINDVLNCVRAKQTWRFENLRVLFSGDIERE
jgi:hypothetical protein